MVAARCDAHYTGATIGSSSGTVRGFGLVYFVVVVVVVVIVVVVASVAAVIFIR